MENNLRRTLAAFAFALVFLRAGAPALADSNTQTDLGVLTAIVAGSHVGSENPVPVSGVVPGALLEITQHVDRVRLHLEGLPTIAVTGSNNGAFGHSSASLSLLNSTIMVDIDPKRRFRLGGGFQLVNLTNKNGSNGDVNRVRIASPIFAAGATLPLPKGHFVEMNVNVDPNLRGILLVYNYLGQAQTNNFGLPTANKPEIGAEVDYAAAYGWRHHDVEYLLGFRGLSYHTRDASIGDLVDRNVGGGVTFEVRFLLGK
jgi:hypothetical protein